MRIIIYLMILILTFGCTKNETKKEFIIENYPNIMNIQNVPIGTVDWGAFCFFDMGSWFGYALPDTNIKSSLGSFPGPFLLTHKSWLSNGLSKIKLFDNLQGEYIKLEQAEDIILYYFPGRLNQVYLFNDFKLELNLIFLSKYTAMISSTIENRSSHNMDINIEFVGEIFDHSIKVERLSDRIVYSLPDNAMNFYIDYQNTKTEINNTGGYQLAYNSIIIQPDSLYETVLFHSLDYNDEDFKEYFEDLEQNLEATENLLNQNTERWSNYLNKALNTNSIWSQNKEYTKIAVKSLLTLTNNWKAGIGALQNEGIIPSYAINYFNGFWAWDSWKHAVGVVKFNPELAMNQMRVMFARQDEFGMVPDVIYADSTEDNWRDTKPPLAAWAVWRIYEETRDRKFVEEMFTPLVTYHYWWYKYRDHDSNGLCEYGGTDSALVTAMWESGMDDAVRFDGAKMLKNSENAWSINQESVDLNSYLYAEKKYLAKMANILGIEEDEKRYLEEAEKLKKNINTLMFDEENGFYYDINVTNKSLIETAGPEGWIPLWAGIADENKASRVKKFISDPQKFSTYVPFPTVSADDEKYMSGYWRGPVWLDQAYFAIKGLKNYGFDDEAENFTKQLFDRAEGLKNSKLPIRENYDPRDGKGLNANHFSWSAAHLLLLYLDM